LPVGTSGTAVPGHPHWRRRLNGARRTCRPR
jgi:hypothetical protein